MMRFTETTVSGTYLIEPDKKTDHRGFFARAWCVNELDEHGLKSRFVQSNIGFSAKKGTIRGLHYQLSPRAEAKLVRCTRGAVMDVVVDLRPESVTFSRWVGVELTEDTHRMLYVPEGCAHGYQALVDGAEVLYETTEFYASDLARGVRFDDPAFGIRWPLPVEVLSDADRSWPDFPRDERMGLARPLR
jgi:dTDP-4-dehydrorhamnose 3,5-epimerase